jgi:hypothetical protein
MDSVAVRLFTRTVFRKIAVTPTDKEEITGDGVLESILRMT